MRKRDRVWYHIPTNQLGYAILDSILGSPLFIFKDHDSEEILSPRFCNFVDDVNDPNSFKQNEFIDLGVL